jgi:hypothetical protein
MEGNCVSLFTVVDLHVTAGNIKPLSVNKETQKIDSLCTGVEQQNTSYCCQEKERVVVKKKNGLLSTIRSTTLNNKTDCCQE